MSAFFAENLTKSVGPYSAFPRHKVDIVFLEYKVLGGSMDKFIARLNIEHYRKVLADEADEKRRQKILQLLAEEEVKLAALEG